MPHAPFQPSPFLERRWRQVLARGLQDLITFELVDYRDFAKQHPGEFDRIISCEMVRLGSIKCPPWLRQDSCVLSLGGGSNTQRVVHGQAVDVSTQPKFLQRKLAVAMASDMETSVWSG